jgi:hypothetical protein
MYKLNHMIPFAFLPNKLKWLGLMLVILGFVIHGIYHPDVTSIKDGLGLLVQILVLFGLLVIICSKQKIEDEFINHYRLISLQWSVILLIFLRLTWKTIGYFESDESWMPHWQVNSLLFFYLIQFYYLCYVKERISKLFKPGNEK